MSRTFGRQSAFARLVVTGFIVGGLIAIATNPVPAAAQSSIGMVTVTAVIAPVRSIVVDERGTIRQIQSNTPAAVTPIVYRNSLTGTQLALTPPILAQYNGIITRVDTQHTGIIYRYVATHPKHQKPPGLVAWLRTYERFSVLPLR